MPMDFPSSPTVGQQYNGYVWTGTAWDSTSAQPISLSTTAPGYNYIINGGFDIWQRGTSFSGTNGYIADRFTTYCDTLTNKSWSRVAFTAGECPAPQVGSKYYLRYTETVSSTGNNFYTQPIEDVETLAGQTVTFSWYAKASTARSIDARFSQNFGSGGSATEYTPRVTFNLTTSWARYTHTVTIPSISGKTIGTNSFLGPMLYISNSQVGTVDIWGMQVEQGSAATAFRRNAPSIQGELAACQRYYLSISGNITNGYKTGADTFRVATVFFPVQMRITPSVSATWSDSTAAGSNGVNQLSAIPVKNIGNTTTEIILTSLTATAEL